MVNFNSGYFLNNYELGIKEAGLCLVTGLRCIPYAKRHWALSEQKYSTWHNAMGYVEHIPVIGALVALIERICAIFASLFSTPSKLNAEQKEKSSSLSSVQHSSALSLAGNATASEFISCCEAPEQEVKDFLARGGSLNIMTPDKIGKGKILIRKKEQVITGCNSGVNRSQVAAAVMKKMGATVVGVLAGGDSGMNPDANCLVLSNSLEADEKDCQSVTNFIEVFGMPKSLQIGARLHMDEKGLPRYIEDAQELEKTKKFYQDYINKLLPTHFITFATSGPSVLKRLLQRSGSLEGFTITYSQLGDEVAHPPAAGDKIKAPKKCSVEAYKAFAEKLRDCFVMI